MLNGSLIKGNYHDHCLKSLARWHYSPRFTDEKNEAQRGTGVNSILLKNFIILFIWTFLH